MSFPCFPDLGDQAEQSAAASLAVPGRWEWRAGRLLGKQHRAAERRIWGSAVRERECFHEWNLVIILSNDYTITKIVHKHDKGPMLIQDAIQNPTKPGSREKGTVPVTGVSILAWRPCLTKTCLARFGLDISSIVELIHCVSPWHCLPIRQCVTPLCLPPAFPMLSQPNQFEGFFEIRPVGLQFSLGHTVSDGGSLIITK
ncbi:hypothetical protein B0T17DRAFT_601701 [Bombardia bombarda]|uniref:Uncharacterized protein n=1 Tax=Bombardia bombarda TaxID=252184 RepID=A0AA39WI19_9PEZI|nr:hypothetical protein B0T17DRAFT_601701 [Bombardia bombarda]